MKEILERLRLFGLQLLGILIDSAFVGLWVILHTWFETHVAAQFRVSGIHAYTFSAFQGIFALGTFFPVASYVLVDICRIYRKTRAALATVGK